MNTLFLMLSAGSYFDFIVDFGINLVTIFIFCYGIYYKRYKDKEAFTSYMLFNVFVFTIITVLFNMASGVSVGMGFGLFAILSIVTLRSETMQKKEITYFFGALAIAIINAIGLTDYPLILMCNGIILLGAWVIDNPNILRGVYGMKITLDYIPDGILDNSEKIKKSLSEKFGIEVISYSVSNIDYVKDTLKLKITYHINNGQKQEIEV